MDIYKLKPTLNFITKAPRLIKSVVKVEKGSLIVTDLCTSVKIKDDFDMTEGVHAFDTLSLVEPVENFDIGSYPTPCFNIESEYKFTWDNKELRSFLPFASRDETRPFLNCVAISQSHLVALDGYKGKFTPLQVDNENDYLMPRESLLILSKLLKKYKIRGQFTVELGDLHFCVDTEFFTLSARLIKREFPKWKVHIPKTFKHEIFIDRWIDTERLKPLFNTNNAVEVSVGQGLVWAQIRGHEKKYLIGYCNKELELSIGFNAEFLSIALEKKQLSSLKLNDELNAVIVNNNVVIMPLKL